jgi:outer membrane biosynthesis protein TonB
MDRGSRPLEAPRRGSLLALLVAIALAASPGWAGAQTTTEPTTTEPTTTEPTTTQPTETAPQPPPPAPEDDPSAFAYVESVPTADGPSAQEPKPGPTPQSSVQQAAPVQSQSTREPSERVVAREKPARKHKKRRSYAAPQRREPLASAPAPRTGASQPSAGTVDETSLIWLLLGMLAVTGASVAAVTHGRRRASF